VFGCVVVVGAALLSTELAAAYFGYKVLSHQFRHVYSTLSFSEPNFKQINHDAIQNWLK